MLRFTVFALAATLATPAHAGAGLFKQFVVIDQGSGDEYYDTFGVSETTDFQGIDFGEFCPTGTPLQISGGEANSFQNGFDDIYGSNMYVTVFPTGERPFSPYFTTVPLFYQGPTPFGSFGDKQWANTGADIDVTSGYAAGDYTIEVYYEGFGSLFGFFQFSVFDSNGGFNYTANYSVFDDPDADCVGDTDNCPNTSNADQFDVDGDGFGDACDNCPNVDNPGQDDADSNGIGDACEDSDGDGVLDSDDLCPGTDAGAVTDADGCSGDQIVDADCPCDGGWRNHGGYVSCVSQTADGLVIDGLLTEAEADAIISSAARSSCGKRSRP